MSIQALPPAKAEFNINVFRDRFMPLVRNRHYDEARNYLDDMLHEHPQAPELRFEAGFEFEKRAEILEDINEHKAERLRVIALKHFVIASDLVPQKYNYAFRAGSVARKIGSGAALVYLERAINIDPKSAHPWFELGLYHTQFDRREMALVCFQNAARLDPHDRLLRKVLKADEMASARGPVNFQPLSYRTLAGKNP